MTWPDNMKNNYMQEYKIVLLQQNWFLLFIVN